MTPEAEALAEQLLVNAGEFGQLVASQIDKEFDLRGLSRDVHIYFEDSNSEAEYEELISRTADVIRGSRTRVQEMIDTLHLDVFLRNRSIDPGDLDLFPSRVTTELFSSLSKVRETLFEIVDKGVQGQTYTALEENQELWLNEINHLADQTKEFQLDLGEFILADRTLLDRFRKKLSETQQREVLRLAHMVRDAQRLSALRLTHHVIEQAMRTLENWDEDMPLQMGDRNLRTAERIFRLGDSTINIFVGNITDSRAHIVVSSDDNLLTMGGGVSRAIQMAAGLEIIRDAGKMVPRSMGDVVVTSAGRMPNRYVIHAVTMMASGGFLDLPRGLMIRQLCHKVMVLLPQLNCRSVAFPAIGAGVARIPYEEVAAEMGEAILDSVLLSKDPVDVELYLTDRFDGDGVERFLAIFESTALGRFGLNSQVETNDDLEVNLTAFMGEGSDSARQADNRISQVIETLRDLDAQRSRIESEILETTNSGSADSARNVWVLTSRLEALAELRRIYESEINESHSGGRVQDGGVFVSSTSKDLREHRSAVRNVVTGLNLRFIGMEDFEANSLAPADLIRQKVMESSTYVGILGMRYGYVDQASGLSMTELEYRQAVAGEKDIRMFVMDEDAPVRASMVERDPHQLELLNDFRERVLTSHACNLFETPSDLADKVSKTLATIR